MIHRKFLAVLTAAVIFASGIMASCAPGKPGGDISGGDIGNNTETETGFTVYFDNQLCVSDVENAVSFEYGTDWKKKIVVKSVSDGGTEKTISDGFEFSGSLASADSPGVGQYTLSVSYKDYPAVGLIVNVQTRKLKKPVDENAVFAYSGSEITYLPGGYDEKFMSISGNKAAETGIYTARITIADQLNTVWEDGLTECVEIEWRIAETTENYKAEELNETTINVTHTEGGRAYNALFVMPAKAYYTLDQTTGEITFFYEEVAETEPVFVLSGSYCGSLVFDADDSVSVTVEMDGFTINCKNACPFIIKNADSADLSAQKDTENFIYDNREAADELQYAIYSECDLKLKGGGILCVVSVNNNGIYSKDDLNVQKLTLTVECEDNALKGNDGVGVMSGNVTLTARRGDGIKTGNTALSSKGKQKGNITVEGGNVVIYAACDGIDAACSVIISDGNVTVYTDKYSEYSEEVVDLDTEALYIRAAAANYKYSLYYSNADDNEGVWVSTSGYTVVSAGRENWYYYKTDRLGNYAYVTVYVYSLSQQQGQADEYYRVSERMTVHSGYDTISFGSVFTGGRPGQSERERFEWTNYSTVFEPGGGMQEGNADKGNYSAKGIKAGNEITVAGGEISVQAYDDAFHTDNDGIFESGLLPTGNILISGGVICLYSNDDGIHGDGRVEISGGAVSITGSYEGIEGSTVVFSGGKTSVLSSDDGVNAISENSTGITVSGGMLYVFAGGDGLDANSTVSYGGIFFDGGKSVIISKGNADSAIDTERGYGFNGGYVIAIGAAGGMSGESVNCVGFSSVGKSVSLSLQSGCYLIVSETAVVKMPAALNARIVVLGNVSASVSVASVCDCIFGSDGVCWLV